jgi:hypothetical protein
MQSKESASELATPLNLDLLQSHRFTPRFLMSQSGELASDVDLLDPWPLCGSTCKINYRQTRPPDYFLAGCEVAPLFRVPIQCPQVCEIQP